MADKDSEKGKSKVWDAFIQRIPQGLKIILHNVWVALIRIFAEKNILFEVAAVFAFIIDFVYQLGSFGVPTLVTNFLQPVTSIFPDTNQLSIMLILFFITFGLFRWWVILICIPLEFLPVVNLIPFFTFFVGLGYLMLKAKEETPEPGSGLTKGEKTYSVPVILIRVIAGIALTLMLLASFIGAADQVLGNVPGQIIGAATPTVQLGLENAQTQFSDFLVNPLSIFTNLGKSLNVLFTSPFNWLDRQLVIGSGGYYQGQVDKNANKPLGVYLRDVAPADKESYLDGKFPIQVFANIEAQSLEVDDCENYYTAIEMESILEGYTPEEKALYFQNQLYTSREDCYIKQKVELWCGIKSRRISVPMIPATVDLYNIDNAALGVECNLDAYHNSDDPLNYLLKPGSDIVDVKAIFPFVTKSYLKTYFMDTNRFRDMKRQKIDPLSYYKITDRKPVAIYTGGPIMIGIGIQDELPLKIDVSSGSTSSGVTSLPGLTGRATGDISAEELKRLEDETAQNDYLYQNPGQLTKEQMEQIDASEAIDDSSYDQYTGGDQNIVPGTPSSALSQSIRIGITLDNKWKGSIKEIISLEMILPQGLSLNCPQYFDPKPGDATTYVLTDLIKNQVSREGGIPKSKTINCRLQVTNPSVILNNVPIATKYIKVTANYKYQIEESTSVRFKKGDGFKKPFKTLEECSTICDDDDGCTCEVNCPGKTPNPSNPYVTPLDIYKGSSCNGDSMTIVDSAIGAVANTVINYALTGVSGKTYCWHPDTSKLTNFRFAGQVPPGNQESTNIYNTAGIISGVSGGKTYVTHYYVADRKDFGSWSTTNKYPLGGTEACQVKNKGFYEAVKCEGTGIDSTKSLMYRYNTIVLTEGQNALPITIPYSPKLTVAADPSIPKNTWLFIDYGANNEWSCCYQVQDRGSLINGNHLDLFTGYNQYPSGLSNSFPRVYEYPNCIKDYEAKT
jgi:3D (Asp-Asp-Asp) domain-containing protein